MKILLFAKPDAVGGYGMPVSAARQGPRTNRSIADDSSSGTSNIGK